MRPVYPLLRRENFPRGERGCSAARTDENIKIWPPGDLKNLIQRTPPPFCNATKSGAAPCLQVPLDGTRTKSEDCVMDGQRNAARDKRAQRPLQTAPLNCDRTKIM